MTVNKKRLIYACLISACLLTGCDVSKQSGLQPQNIKSTQLNTSQNVTATDNIYSIGYPTYNGVRQKGSILTGEKYAYLLSSGTESLQLLTELNPEILTIQQPIRIYLYPDNSVYIEIKVVIDNNPSYKSGQPKKVLQQLCPTLQTTDLPPIKIPCTIKLQGGMYAALENTNYVQKMANGLKAEIYSVAHNRIKTKAEVGVIPLKIILESIEAPLEFISVFK